MVGAAQPTIRAHVAGRREDARAELDAALLDLDVAALEARARLRRERSPGRAHATVEPHLRFTRSCLSREGRGLDLGFTAGGEIGREPRAIEVRDQRSEIDAAPHDADVLAIGVEVPARVDVGAATVASERPAGEIEPPVGEAQAAAGGERTDGIPAQAGAAKVGLDAQAFGRERERGRALDLAGRAQLGEELAHDVGGQAEVGFERAVDLRALAQSSAHGEVGARAFELGLRQSDLGTGDLALGVEHAGVEHAFLRRAHADRGVGARREAGDAGTFERDARRDRARRSRRLHDRERGASRWRRRGWRCARDRAVLPESVRPASRFPRVGVGR